MTHDDEYDAYEPDEDYLEYERERVFELALDEIQASVGPVPPVLAEAAAEWLVPSYDVKGDIGWDADGNVCANDLEEVFRRDPRQAIREGRKAVAREFFSSAIRGSSRSRGPSRAPRRGTRRRTRAAARSPGRLSNSDDDPSPLAHSRSAARYAA